MYKAIEVTPRNEGAIRKELGGADMQMQDLQGFFLVVDTTYKKPWEFFPPALFELHYQFLRESPNGHFAEIVERRV